MFAQQVLAYPLLTPPGVPIELVEALRRAFDATMTDGGFLDDARKQDLKVDPVSGARSHIVGQALRHAGGGDESICRSIRREIVIRNLQ